MVICTCSVTLYGEMSGEYKAGQTYSDERLAGACPACFVRVPVIQPEDEPEHPKKTAKKKGE